VRIAPECSGFEGMGLMAVFATSYVWLFRRRLRFPQLLLLPPAGVALIWLLNGLRLVALVLIGTRISKQAAVDAFHSLAGTFLFCMVALGLVFVSSRSRFFSALGERGRDLDERDGTAAYLLPFLISVALGMIAGGLGDAVRTLELLKLCAVLLALWLFRRSYPPARSKSWAVALVLGAAAFALWIGISRLLASESPGSSAVPGPSGAWLLIRILGSVCVTPLVEELAFRGYLLRRLCAPGFEAVGPAQITTLAWISSSLLFGALHEHWIAAALAGAIYGFAYMRRGQLLDCVVAHAFTNLLLILLATYRGDWSLV
jgi:exosortase E/protease (VPEID-CTERM system)